MGFTTEDYLPVPGALVNITAAIGMSPPARSIFEGWLIDPDIPTFYNLTLGQFVKSQEQVGDTDPRISNIVVGGSEFQLTPEDIVGGSKLNLY